MQRAAKTACFFPGLIVEKYLNSRELNYEAINC